MKEQIGITSDGLMASEPVLTGYARENNVAPIPAILSERELREEYLTLETSEQLLTEQILRHFHPEQ